jgi:hypothetical protein
VLEEAMNDRFKQTSHGRPLWFRAVRPRSRTARAWRYPAAAVAFAAMAGACLAGCGSVASGSGHSASGSSNSGLTGAQAAGSSKGSGSGGAASNGAGTAGATKSATLTGALCVHRDAVTKLTVVRPITTPRSKVLHFPFPGQMATKSASSARAVAAAVCALPPLSNNMSCPAMLPAPVYALTFWVAGRALPVVTANPTACQPVTGAGPIRTATAAPHFWFTLGDAIGLYRAGWAIFGGQGPTVHQCQARTSGRNVLNGCPGVTAPVHGTAPVPAS